MLETWQTTDDPLVMEKELLPSQEICPYVDESGKPVSVKVREAMIDGIVDQFQKFQEVGVRVPLFKTHKEDPDNDRGTIIGVRKARNKKGQLSTFIQVRFHDAEAKKHGTRVDVSAMCPASFVDGKGNKYQYPLRHVALTSVPVVPGLEGWKGPIVLSYDLPYKDLSLAEGAMNELIDQILAALEIAAPEGSDEATKLRLILQAVQPDPEEEADPAAAPPVALSFPAVMVKQMRDARSSIVEGLIRDEVVTPAHGKKLTDLYCSQDAMVADLKLSADDAETGTEFDRVVSQLREQIKNRPLGKSGRRSLRLSGDKGGEDNPLIAGAKRMREAAAK